jgi:signal transduction histidine kinase
MTRQVFAVPPVAEALVHCVDTGVLVVADDVVVTANREFRLLFSGTADQLVGEPVAALESRQPYAAATEFWAARHGEHGRRCRCTLPGDRVVEARWHTLPSDDRRLLAAVVGDRTSEANVRRRLREHNRALAELVASKTELVSALLHELRTPLTAALAMVDLLSEDDAADPALPMVARKLHRIDEVTTEIATIGGIESGAVALERQEFDLPALLTEAAADTGVVVTARPQRGLVTGDRARLGQVFRRLTAAVRAIGGPDEEMVAEEVGDRWRIALPLPGRLATDRLFTAADSGGNATALMLARAVTGRHGGTVGVESAGGSPFLTVWLPR